MIKYFSFVLLCFSFISLNSQTDQKIDITNNLFIKKALVISKPESTPVEQSLIIRNGIITQIGTDLKAPFDCKILNADSLYLYAGFIDAMSHTGVKKEEEDKDAAKPNSRGEANLEQSGVTPQINALSKISIKESGIGDMRKTGFTTSHVFPRGKMIAGNSSIISLSNADHKDKMLVKNNIALHSSLTPANSVYPSTVIGVFSKYRELYKNTEIYIKNKQAYDTNPLGLSRPIFSDELNALTPVVRKELPVFFVTKNVKDIYRAIELQKEIGFKMVIAEVKNVTSVIDKIKANNYSILLSLDLPDEIKDDKKADTKIDSTKKDTTKVLSAEIKLLEERKKKSYTEYLSQAALLEKNNIPFSFSYIEVKPGDIFKSLRKYIKNGLSEKTALAALTVIPAQLLNITSTHGTVEVGKTANLVLTAKPLFDEKSSIKYTIVDGKVFEYYESAKSENKNDKSKINLEGTWSYTGEMNGQTQSGTIDFKKDDEKYKATVKPDNIPDQSYNSDDVVVNGSKVEFSIIANLGQPTIVKFSLDIDKDEFKGKADIENIGIIDLTGSKKKSPEFKF